ncbi:FAD-binding oxidoreductase [Chromohalobacter canadensis]|uniref:NAD(P)/FAD-dependent oxidoreductase n=1 Tax=Chromohalobacter canadensis TaxID=141389 RepID=UPI0021BF743D|nr:FAD-dependent oxidoreductase [Chromohalobacter canadensis]MCT8467243.1 FAD-binding oxidoreductase [Chromohalobacter canadensis]MCT8471009.1 FAD-binding oxidoreductase [Chromohalobacter canadensis]MCT8497740.1 FAD-binding oxidoreductase [Chromohalobacter canadensis]
MYDDASCNFWTSTLAERPPLRPRLEANVQADVAIVGAGFTGLWTAYYLKRLSPGLEIVVLEAERVGHGASGRNGGWVVGNLAGLERHIGGLSREERRTCCGVVADNVDEIGRVLAREGIDADFNKGGAIYAAARYRDQIAIQRDYLQHLHELGHSEADCYWLDAEQLSAKARFRNGHGGIYHRQVATVNPARLVTGLAELVERLGVTIHEQSRAETLAPNKVSTHEGSVEAPTIVCATEGYADRFHDYKRHVIPVQSLVVATEPISDDTWEEVGMSERLAFSDASRLINYGHRTADGRIVFGARGNYYLGARPKADQAIGDDAIRMRRDLLVDLLPALEGVRIDYGWGGSLGLSRNFRPHAIFDHASGLATAGGYAGEGVAASHLFGRTLADMILERDTQLVRMPWAFTGASHRQLIKRWEVEPLRWLAAQTITCCYAGEEALMRRDKSAPLLKSALRRLNDRFASIIE